MLCSVRDGVGYEAMIEGCQLSSMRHGEREQIGVGDLAGGCETAQVHLAWIEDADVVWPEAMPGMPTQV